MTPLEFRLLDEFQRDFPLVPEPYAAIAATLGTATSDVLAALGRLSHDGTVSRIGAVLRPGAIGASTLAAIAVSEDRLESVASIVSACPEVSHNYEREHALNLWFVATAADAPALEGVLRGIECKTGCRALGMRLVEEYHIDLGFRLGAERRALKRGACGPQRPIPVDLGTHERKLAAMLARGLALVPRPYAELARSAGLSEAAVLDTLARWQASGIVRRFGVIVRHHELGYGANAMAVWDVDDDRVAAAGARLAREPRVTLAYRRERALPVWPYNLYCMVHGRERDEVEAVVATAGARAGLVGRAHAVLFSRRRFKQAAAHWSPPTREPAWTPSIG